jgi:hypothetical protein
VRDRDLEDRLCQVYRDERMLFHGLLLCSQANDDFSTIPCRLRRNKEESMSSKLERTKSAPATGTAVFAAQFRRSADARRVTCCCPMVHCSATLADWS